MSSCRQHAQSAGMVQSCSYWRQPYGDTITLSYRNCPKPAHGARCTSTLLPAAAAAAAAAALLALWPCLILVLFGTVAR